MDFFSSRKKYKKLDDGNYHFFVEKVENHSSNDELYEGSYIKITIKNKILFFDNGKKTVKIKEIKDGYYEDVDGIMCVDGTLNKFENFKEQAIYNWEFSGGMQYFFKLLIKIKACKIKK